MMHHSLRGLPYLSRANYNDPNVRNTKVYASTGISHEVEPNHKIGAGIGYRQASFKSSRDSLTGQLGYTVQF